LGFIDKALEKAKAVRKKEETPKPPADISEPALASPFPLGEMATEPSIIPPEINYNITRTLPVDPENLRRNRIIAGGWEAGSSVVEGYKVLRTLLLHHTAEEGRNTLMITGPFPGEGKTLTAINLAIILSHEINHTVLLVDADLRSPSITRYFGLGDQRGIVDYLTAGVPIPSLLIHPQGISKLVVLPAGRAVPQAAELLNSPVMRDLVQELKHFYRNRYVIFDLPPMLVYADALAFAPLMDGIIVVVEAHKTPKENIQRCQEMLKKFKLLGFVLNKLEETSIPDYLSYYYPQIDSPKDGKKRFKFLRFK
jgi:exopolysaccharide/PEP-CTERM locus tyrosine autokinase